MTFKFWFKNFDFWTKEKARYGAIIQLSFIKSRTFSFKFSNALLILIEVSATVVVKFLEVTLTVSVRSSNIFFVSS